MRTVDIVLIQSLRLHVEASDEHAVGWFAALADP